MEFTNSKIIDSNGQKYRVGWDEHGWFTIQDILLHDPDDFLTEADEFDLVEYHGQEYVLEAIANYSFTSSGAEIIAALIEDGP